MNDLRNAMVKSPLTIAGAILLAATAAGYAQTSTPIYSYTVPANGYAPNGNLSAYTDSVMGTWAMQYDNLDRLQNAAASAGPYQGLNLQWGFDSFGNRTSQIPSGTSNASLPGPSSPSYDANNRVVSGNGSFTPTYDAAGNMTFDGAATYTAYDGDNRVCATYSTIGGSGVTQYIYNAEGQRVAKGHPVSSPGNTPFCPTDMANFVADSKYVLGPSSEQMTEVDGSGTWRHTNVYNGGQMLATYDTHGLHFPQTDPLGTVRVQASATGAAEESCASLPFGDGLNCTPAISEPTEHHFTGKERDAESGLDYFGARYYGSSMGRMMSPDPLLFNELRLINPQRWNMYAYAINNPLSFTDPDGRDAIAVNFQGDVHGLGHMGIISLHKDGTATYSRFGPQHPGQAADVGQVRTDTDLPKVAFDSKGEPTDASFSALTAAVSKFEDYTGQVNMFHFQTSEAETGALDEYIKAAQAASDAGKLSYVGPISTCATYCAIGLHRAGVNARGAMQFNMIPNLFAVNLFGTADKVHLEKVTVRMRPDSIKPVPNQY